MAMAVLARSQPSWFLQGQSNKRGNVTCGLFTESAGLVALTKVANYLRSNPLNESLQSYLRAAILNAFRDCWIEDDAAGPCRSTIDKNLAKNPDESGRLIRNSEIAIDDTTGKRQGRLGEPMLNAHERGNRDIGAVDCQDSIESACEDPLDRKIVRLRSEGFTIREVADQLSIDHTTVSRRVTKLQSRVYCEGVELLHPLTCDEISERFSVTITEARRMPRVIDRQAYTRAAEALKVSKVNRDGEPSKDPVSPAETLATVFQFFDRGLHECHFVTGKSCERPGQREGTAIQFWKRADKWWVVFHLDQQGDLETQRVSPPWFLRNILGIRETRLRPTKPGQHRTGKACRPTSAGNPYFSCNYFGAGLVLNRMCGEVRSKLIDGTNPDARQMQREERKRREKKEGHYAAAV